jgi:excisionase family DNA binding protein
MMVKKERNTSNKTKYAGSEKAPESYDVLDIAGIAALLRVNKFTAYRLCETGDFPARKIGREWRASKAAILRWLDKSTDKCAKRESNDDARLLNEIENGNGESAKAALREAVKKGLPVRAGK